MYIRIPSTDKCKLVDKESFFLYCQHLKKFKIIIIIIIVVVLLFSPQSLELHLFAVETLNV